MTTIDRVRRVFQDNFGEDRLAKFGDDAVPFTDFATAAPGADLDSLDHVEFVMGLEDEFGLSIHDDDAEKISSIATAVAMVEALATEAVSG